MNSRCISRLIILSSCLLILTLTSLLGYHGASVLVQGEKGSQKNYGDLPDFLFRLLTANEKRLELNPTAATTNRLAYVSLGSFGRFYAQYNCGGRKVGESGEREEGAGGGPRGAVGGLSGDSDMINSETERNNINNYSSNLSIVSNSEYTSDPSVISTSSLVIADVMESDSDNYLARNESYTANCNTSTSATNSNTSTSATNCSIKIYCDGLPADVEARIRGEGNSNEKNKAVCIDGPYDRVRLVTFGTHEDSYFVLFENGEYVYNNIPTALREKLSTVSVAMDFASVDSATVDSTTEATRFEADAATPSYVTVHSSHQLEFLSLGPDDEYFLRLKDGTVFCSDRLRMRLTYDLAYFGEDSLLRVVFGPPGKYFVRYVDWEDVHEVFNEVFHEVFNGNANGNRTHSIGSGGGGEDLTCSDGHSNIKNSVSPRWCSYDVCVYDS
jgi:hypothetical protein